MMNSISVVWLTHKKPVEAPDPANTPPVAGSRRRNIPLNRPPWPGYNFAPTHTRTDVDVEKCFIAASSRNSLYVSCVFEISITIDGYGAESVPGIRSAGGNCIFISRDETLVWRF